MFVHIFRVNHPKVIILERRNRGLFMKIPDKEKLFKELTDLINPEQEKEFFCSMWIKKES